MESDEPVVRARDLMGGRLISVTPDTPLAEVHRLFTEEEIHGVPVVTEDGAVLGVVSSLDLLRLWWMPGDDEEELQELTAADAMSPDLVTVGPFATVDEIAHAMLANRVHRVLVCQDGHLQGLVSTFDLVRVLTRGPVTEPYAAATVEHAGFMR